MPAGDQGQRGRLSSPSFTFQSPPSFLGTGEPWGCHGLATSMDRKWYLLRLRARGNGSLIPDTEKQVTDVSQMPRCRTRHVPEQRGCRLLR